MDTEQPRQPAPDGPAGGCRPYPVAPLVRSLRRPATIPTTARSPTPTAPRRSTTPSRSTWCWPGARARTATGGTARRGPATPDVTGADVAGRLERLTGAAVRELRAAGSQFRWNYYRAALADGRQRSRRWPLLTSAGCSAPRPAACAGWARRARPACPGCSAGTTPRWSSRRSRRAGPARRRRAARRRTGEAARGWRAPVRRTVARIHREPFFAERSTHACLPPPAARLLGLDWYRACRVLPYLRLAVDAGTLSGADARLVESAAARAADVAGPDEPSSRIHGDLWSGNVLWSGGSGWLIDPAAHGGHRETDARPRSRCSGRRTWTGSGVPTPTRRRWHRGASACPAAPVAPAARARGPVRRCIPRGGAGRRSRGAGSLTSLRTLTWVNRDRPPACLRCGLCYPAAAASSFVIMSLRSW